MSHQRRVAAVVLPRLLCELAAPIGSKDKTRSTPIGVVLVNEHEALRASESLRAQTRLHAVNEVGRRLGLREGLTIAEAQAFVASLEVRLLSASEVQRALARVAEACLQFTPTVGLAPPDVVHLDLTGAAHLAGGEAALAGALQATVARVGHLARIAIANGPRVAEAVARHGLHPIAVIEPGQEVLWLRDLPLSALPIDDDTTCWFVRVGVVTIGDLTRLARSQVAARLGERAPEIMMLAHGQDPTPLRAYEPPDTLCEEASWDEGIEQQSALLFVAKRLAERLSARLQGRGQALRALELSIQLDRSIARLRGVEEVLHTRLELPAPIDRSEDLLRTIRARLERVDLNAPALGMRLEAALIVRAPRVQLDLSRDVTASPDALPVLLAEMSAEIGAEHFGTLSLVDTHRPEARGRLRPVLTTTGHTPPANSEPGWGASVTRVLPSPLSLGYGRAVVGRIIVCGSLPPLEVQSVTFDARLDGIEWWTATPLHRDYLQAWLQCGPTGATAWLYQDRRTHELKLHGWLD